MLIKTFVIYLCKKKRKHVSIKIVLASEWIEHFLLEDKNKLYEVETYKTLSLISNWQTFMWKKLEMWKTGRMIFDLQNKKY